MPYIPTPKDIRKKYNIHKDKPKTLIANRYKYYRKPQWIKLSSAYRMIHPLDELSILEDKVIPADDAHHIVSPFQQDNEILSTLLLYDTDNLGAVSKHTHGIIHTKYNELTNKQKQFLQQKTDYILNKYKDRGIHT